MNILISKKQLYRLNEDVVKKEYPKWMSRWMLEYLTGRIESRTKEENENLDGFLRGLFRGVMMMLPIGMEYPEFREGIAKVFDI